MAERMAPRFADETKPLRRIDAARGDQMSLVHQGIVRPQGELAVAEFAGASDDVATRLRPTPAPRALGST